MNPEMMTWLEVNRVLRQASEAEALAMLETARRQKLPPRFIFRIYGRYSKQRKTREINDLMRGKKVELKGRKRGSRIEDDKAA